MAKNILVQWKFRGFLSSNNIFYLLMTLYNFTDEFLLGSKIFKKGFRIICFLQLLFLPQLTKAQSNSIILGRPTDTSITASVLLNQLMELYIVYGNQPGVYTQSTPIINNTINTPDEVDLNNLTPDTRFY